MRVRAERGGGRAKLKLSRCSPPPSETRSVPVGLRFTPCLKEALVELARAERRTLTSYIELVLEAHVEAKKQEGKKRR